MTEEEQRLQRDREGKEEWKLWGPYLSERAWGTVREDYSADGDAWHYFPFDHARSRVFRWSEDGLAGISDRNQYLCFALALWNGNDPILKERLFGLTGSQGNHGEDVKEWYSYLDNTPTHSFMKYLYKYPQRAFPYEDLLAENQRRGRDVPEYEIGDTGIFGEDRYFDVTVEYAKQHCDDMLIVVTIVNHGPEAARLHVLPTLWFRNTWTWSKDARRPQLSLLPSAGAGAGPTIRADHHSLGTYYLSCQRADVVPEVLFTENETNGELLFPNCSNATPFVKDGIGDHVVAGKTGVTNPGCIGTKAAAHYDVTVQPGEVRSLRLRLSARPPAVDTFAGPFDTMVEQRRGEADAFYEFLTGERLSGDARSILRQAFAGMLWNKQFYNYDVHKWLGGDPTQPEPPAERLRGRNHRWSHLNNHDIISMPDKWEYPWYASWDLAFHCITFALIDPEFAKGQLLLFLREWYMHPNGQIPAYEWGFGDVNPPVQAWAAMRVYQIERRLRGAGDRSFLKRVFHKLLMNFTWWVNRKDTDGRNVFQGGFMGLDNIGIFDRNMPLPGDIHLEQSDATSWMAMYCLNMLSIALELASEDGTYEDIATKFLEHFFSIAHAMNDRPSARGDRGADLWDEEDGFYYDVLQSDTGDQSFLKIRSMVGIIPLFAVETLDTDVLEKLPGFRTRLEWFLSHRPDLCKSAASTTQTGEQQRRLFSVVDENRLRRILTRVLDEEEFLSSHGIRSVSRAHREHPVRVSLGGETHQIDYEPAESRTPMFGGNSNWRGPIWFPLNYLLIESLQKHDHYYGERLTVECPRGSGQMLTLAQVATLLSQRLIAIFLRDGKGERPVFGANDRLQHDPAFNDLIPFYEYFHGDTGAGLGASHQTGWTGLVAKLILQSGKLPPV